MFEGFAWLPATQPVLLSGCTHRYIKFFFPIIKNFKYANIIKASRMVVQEKWMLLRRGLILPVLNFKVYEK